MDRRQQLALVIVRTILLLALRSFQILGVISISGWQSLGQSVVFFATLSHTTMRHEVMWQFARIHKDFVVGLSLVREKGLSHR